MLLYPLLLNIIVARYIRCIVYCRMAGVIKTPVETKDIKVDEKKFDKQLVQQTYDMIRQTPYKEDDVTKMMLSTIQKLAKLYVAIDNLYYGYACISYLRQMIAPEIKEAFVEITDDEEKKYRRLMVRKANRTKHLRQEIAFVKSVLSKVKIDRSTCVIEVGCGKAELSYLFHRETGCDICPIDIKKATHSATNKVNNGKYCNVVADATTYDFASNSFLKNKRIVIIAKHLCAHIIDLTIKNLLKSGLDIQAIFFSPCCFAGMRYESYMWPDHIKDFSKEEFDFFAHKSIWGTFKEKQLDKDKFMPYLNQLGLLYRDFLNMGRMHFLRSNNFDTLCCIYVPYSITPQNLFVSAVKII